MININISTTPIIGIYKITSPSGKIYIGQSINWKRRYLEYKRLQCKYQRKLYNSLLKHGVENHQFEIIEECNEEQLNEREIYWGEYYNVLGENGLVLKLGSAGGKRSEESKLKQGAATKGRKDSDEARINKSKAFKGRKFTAEHCLKLGQSKKGVPKPKISIKNKGNKYRANKGKIVTQYDKQGNFIKDWNTAQQASEELNIHYGSISCCCLGKTKTAGGFIWKFK
jgi:group I intron endonuclease